LRKLFVYFCVVVLFSCGGKTTTTETPSPTPTVVSKNENELKSVEDLACQQFFAEINAAMIFHITTPAEDSVRGKLLAKGYAIALQSIAKESDPNQLPAKTIEELIASAGESISDCTPYRNAAAKLKASLKINEPLIPFLRYALNKTLQTMDPFSVFIERGGGQETSRWGAGIQFHYRTDYSLARNPNYLVVDRFFDRSLNKDRLATGDRILGIRLYDAEGKKEYLKPISELTFEKADRILNHSSPKRNEIVVRVKRRKADAVDFEPEADVTLKFDSYVSHLAQYESDGRIGVLRLLSFFALSATQDVKGEWGMALREMVKNRETLPEGLILDLRGNGGGYVEQAKALLETLLPLRSVYWHVNRIASPGLETPNSRIGNKLSCVDPPDQTEEDREALGVDTVMLLVDRGTISASEIVAAALRDYQRAIIVGERTFGKGIGQNPFPVGAPLDGTALVTDFLFFSPKGLSHQGRGIQPDVEIRDPVNSFQAENSKVRSRMEDLGTIVTNNVIESARKDLSVTDISPLDDSLPGLIAALNDAKKNMPEPASCTRSKIGDLGFREEDDCLLDWAHQLMLKLFELQRRAAGST
jgi:C-terminal processing protease CtpA/Prc